MAKNTSAMFIVISCGIIGIVFAIIIQMMNADQLLVNELLTGTISLRVIQTVVILVWLIIGVILAVAKQ